MKMNLENKKLIKPNISNEKPSHLCSKKKDETFSNEIESSF